MGKDRELRVGRATLSVLTLIASVSFDAVIQQVGAESMRAAVQRSIRNHPHRKSARKGVAASAHDLEATKGAYLPRVELYGDIGGQNADNDNFTTRNSGGWKASRQIGLSMEYTLFDGYRRANTVYQQAARLDANIYNLLSASEIVALDTTEAYVDVVRHRQLLGIAKQNIRRHLNIQRQIKQRVAGGKSPISDQFQIEERLYAAKAVQVEIEKALADARSKYKRVVGIKPGRKMRIPRVKGLPNSQKRLVSSSISNNVEIRSLGKVASAAEYERDASKSVLKPRVSLESRLSAGADRNGTSGSERDAYVGLRLRWSLYDGGTSGAATSALTERAGQVTLQRDFKVREVRELAEQSWTSYVKGRERDRILRKQVKSNAKIVKNYREEYQLTKRSLLDVLDAERARFNSQFQQVSVSASYRFAQFRMLATQSKLARYFGATGTVPRQRPTFERQVTQGGQSVFNINIEPLK